MNVHSIHECENGPLEPTWRNITRLVEVLGGGLVALGFEGFTMPVPREAPASRRKAPTAKAAVTGELAMCPRVIGHRHFTDGATQLVHEDERGQFIEDASERVERVWLVPGDDWADTPVIVETEMV